jgi:hypothetical protein
MKPCCAFPPIKMTHVSSFQDEAVATCSLVSRNDFKRVASIQYTRLKVADTGSKTWGFAGMPQGSLSAQAPHLQPAPTRSTCTSRYRDAGSLVVGASFACARCLGAGESGGRERSGSRACPRAASRRKRLTFSPLLQASCLQQWGEFVGAPVSSINAVPDAMFYGPVAASPLLQNPARSIVCPTLLILNPVT